MLLHEYMLMLTKGFLTNSRGVTAADFDVATQIYFRDLV